MARPPAWRRRAGAAISAIKRPRLSATAQHALFAYGLVFPAVLLLLGLVGYPFLYAIFISFTNRVVGNAGHWVGLGEFPLSRAARRISSASVWNTITLVVVSDACKLAIGLSLALLVNQRLPGRGLFRSVLMLPWAMPAFVVFMVWRVVYQPIGGGLNLVLTATGIYPDIVDWLGQRATAMPAVIAATVWRGFPFWFISILAGAADDPRRAIRGGAGGRRQCLAAVSRRDLPRHPPGRHRHHAALVDLDREFLRECLAADARRPVGRDDGVSGARLFRHADPAARPGGGGLGGDAAGAGHSRVRRHRHGAARERRMSASLHTTAVYTGSLRRAALLNRIATYAALAVACLLVLFPVYWMAATSLKLPRDILRTPSLWPHVFTLNNYRILLFDKGFLVAIRNSFVVSASVTLISIVISSLAAYSLARFRTRFRGVIGRLILFAYLTPTSLLFIPLSIVMAQLGLGNSLVGLVLVYLTFSLPLSTWLLQSYFRSVPRELEEQGTIDGLTRLGALLRIVLPLSAPGLAAVSIFTFTGAWNELLLALVLVTSDSQRTAPLALNYLITSDTLPWGPLMAGAVLSSLPLIVLFFIAQRFMVQGITAGSVKG